ncbi:MAG: acetyltransferase [Reichenbachiella sp.]
MKEDIVLIGGGGHCRAVIDVIETLGQYKIAGILDKPALRGTKILDHTIIGSDEDIPLLTKKYKNFLITIGQIEDARLREALYLKVCEAGGNLPFIVSPLSHVAKTASIGAGTIVMHHVIVNANVTIGVNNIINTKSLIEHDTVIGNHNHISTNAVINGDCLINDYTFIGSGSVLNQGRKIVDNTVIASMSLVNKDIITEGVYVGVPVKQTSLNEE